MQTPRIGKKPLIFILSGAAIVIIAVVALVLLKPFGNSVKEDIWAVKPTLEYYYLLPFSEGLAAVGQDGKWGYIDKTGNEVIPCVYDGTASFSEGLAWVRQDGKWGIISKEKILKVIKETP